jgi:hypothetical protein
MVLQALEDEERRRAEQEEAAQQAQEQEARRIPLAAEVERGAGTGNVSKLAPRSAPRRYAKNGTHNGSGICRACYREIFRRN